MLQPCYSLALRCLGPGIMGVVPVCATALLQPASQEPRSRDHGCGACVLQPCYSLVFRCIGPGIMGVVPVCATALLQPSSQVPRPRDHE